jgi:hypothetical protein
MTAVEWLMANLISEPISEADFENNIDCWNEAEEMEKQQQDEFAIGFAEWLFENCNTFPKEDQSLILKVYKKEKGL